jgi:formate-dependent nitrite reductase cytochrome c552 subunit
MHLKGVKCIDCHMPEATRSAFKKGKYKGDVKTHLFKINLDPGAQMFTKDGKFANGFLTVEFACLACHQEKTRAWAIATSKRVHFLGKK